MSYILDALKKADAQRERDPARGIHAQPAPLPTLQQPGLGQRPWFRVAAASGLAALVAAGWFLSQDSVDVQRPPVPASDAALPRSSGVPEAARAPLGTTAAAPEPVAAAVLPPPAPAAPVPLAPVQGKGAAPPGENATRVARATKAPPATGAATDAPAATASPGAPAAAPAARAAASEPPIANGLPPDAPKLAISGGVYSANRAQRMLIVDGQVVNEGADLGAGMVLEEIRPKSAVLRFRGGRYNVGF